MFDQKMKEVQQVIEQNTHQKKLYIQSLKKYLIELEEKSRKELRQWCNEQQVRLGKWHTNGQISNSNRTKEMWQEGEAYRKINQRIQQIQIEKEEIEKLKKNRKRDSKLQNKAKLNNLPLVPDAFGHTTEQSEFDLEESEFNNIDKNEMKEIY
jgi:hypothetical protein